MEKIKQALDRARSLNESRDDLKFHPRLKDEQASIQTITYTQTKSIELNLEELRQKRILIGDTNDIISDQYKVLRTQVIQRMNKNNWKTLAISSPTEECGKTLTSINLCVSIAKDVNQSVMLVDMDLRRPNVHEYFYKHNKLGISDYINGDEALKDILFNPGLDRFVILPGNETIADSSEMLSSPRMRELVNEVKSRYQNRFIVFDMPPLLSCDDMLAFSPQIDAIMLVIEEGVTSKQDLKRSYDLIDKNKILGVVLNKSLDATSKTSYY
ncbi:MAG: CpsD/CapB family tyrosine-protein kinase [Candidatus Thiodiazotropha weberae]|uniref:CpsD/CapB family tyrosine-protein kinase n=1 Tax=Candidatus Thiodiazotropha endoloripes TaxID=1818881 RepID=UPI00083DDEF5|nr:CpsD/CapB family tyrosine-protein kinase [Candidatus Thiodiazotropha endoloripes]MCG7899551.1 CpsD/CapB family tyrosine-protein kinase [Candidatus Thiodiazotropha weberae]ODB89569.1 hypothetical protein A3194_10435 [Candidatus Thiodiazotropha endoloripes]